MLHVYKVTLVLVLVLHELQRVLSLLSRMSLLAEYSFLGGVSHAYFLSVSFRVHIGVLDLVFFPGR